MGMRGWLMFNVCALSPQGLIGKDKELVLGLGHHNNSYNFSVSVCELPWCPLPQSGGLPS